MTNEEVDKILSQAQKDLLKKSWNGKDKDYVSLINLTKLACPGVPNLTQRSREYKAVKTFFGLATIKGPYVPKKVELSEENKEYIKNNITEDNLETAKLLFKNNKLKNNSKECRAVDAYKKNITEESKEVAAVISRSNEGTYLAPESVAKLASRVNEYITNAFSKQRTNQQEKNLESLSGYLNTYRFIHQINTYPSEVDKKLFESSFIRYTYDKADLTQEEVDQYIVLCTEVVISANIQRTIQTMQEQIAVELDSGEKIPMTLVEAVNSARTEYNQCVGRQQKLLNDLKVKRSERISKQVKENASILNLVQMWKDEESRKEMIKMADMRREVLKTEINKLSSMDDVKARIFGLTEEEVLDG